MFRYILKTMSKAELPVDCGQLFVDAVCWPAKAGMVLQTALQIRNLWPPE